MMSRPNIGYQGAIVRLRTFWLRYAHIASLQERSTSHHWMLSIRPHDPAACPCRIIVARDGTCAFDAGPIAYDNVPLDPIEYMLAISAAVVEGRIEQSEQRCPWTGFVRERQARITLNGTPKRTFEGGYVNGLLALVLPRRWCTQVTSRYAAYPIAERRTASNVLPLPQQVFLAPPTYAT